MGTTVTLEKAYFETLLRRAEFHTAGRDLTTPINISTVSIPKADHDNLLQMAREYSSLKESLYKGGITQETLEILIQGEGVQGSETTTQETWRAVEGADPINQPMKTNVTISRDHTQVNELAFLRSSSPRSLPDEPAWNTARLRPGFHHQHSSFNDDGGSFTPEVDSLATPRSDRPLFARTEQRTILLKGLPESVTHSEIVKVLRGGTVLDIFIRPSERLASVSFVEGASAQQFFAFAKKNDIYISGKRVEIQWSDRQFILPGHVANKIGIGATRNLVLRGVHPHITEERIREDLDHIHNLVVIGMSFRGGDAFIELNSIHNSLFARTCMISRAAYKGMKIQWYPDECAQPIPRVQHVPRKEARSHPSAKKSNSTPNRFQMLMNDGTEEDSSDEEEPSHSVLSDLSNLNISSRSPWNLEPIAA